MDKLSKWLNLFASLGVIAGLVFLAIEINQNTQATIAAASQELTNQSLEFFSLGMDNQKIGHRSPRQKSRQFQCRHDVGRKILQGMDRHIDDIGRRG